MNRRTWLMVPAGFAVVALAGCASEPIRRRDPSGHACFAPLSRRRSKRLTCGDATAPTPSAEAEARQLLPHRDLFTLYILRERLGDVGNAVPVAVDGRPGLVTIPFGFARLRLSPGPHVVATRWNGQERSIQLDGKPGEVQFVELHLSNRFWGDDYEWTREGHASMAQRIRGIQFIADLDLSNNASS